MKLAALVFGALAATASAATELTEANFDSTLAGKNALVKFLAPCAKGVSGYPTIKYYVDGEENAYSGGRDYDQLKAFVQDNLEPKCSVAEQDGCTDREKKYIVKMQGQGAEGVAKQLARLTEMQNKSMKPELKAWVQARLRLLKEL